MTWAEITTVAEASAVDADAAVQAATRVFEDGRRGRMHHGERAKVLVRMARLMDERADDFAIREAMAMGLPDRDFRASITPHRSGLFRFFAGYAMAHMDGAYRRSSEADIRILTRREPPGVVAAITPFDFPLALCAPKVAPALAAGNCVIHKPASDTSLALAQLARDAGVPKGVVVDLGARPVDAGGLSVSRWTEAVGMLLIRLGYGQGMGPMIGAPLLRYAGPAS